MIIEQNTELKTMRFLVRYWHKSFSVYEIAKEARISAPMVYNVIKKLEGKKIVIKEGGKIKLNFNNPFAYAFKLIYDAERMIELSEEEQNKLNHVFAVFNREYANNLLALMVFGSAASKEQTEKSDIDILIIVKKKKEFDYRKKGLLSLENLNIIEKEEQEFGNEYFFANDLIINALMNGIIVFDNGIIKTFLNKPLPKPSYEVILQKKERLDVLKDRLFVLLKEKNYKELSNQLKFFIVEKARILFLEKGVIPSSRNYIINNLSKIDKSLNNDYMGISEKNVKEILRKYV